MRLFYPKNHPNQIFDYWLITPNKEILYIETDVFQLQAILKQRAIKRTPLTMQYRLQSIRRLSLLINLLG